MARAMLNMTQANLAESAGVSLQALGDFESDATEPRASTLRAIQNALEDAGAEFGADDSVKRRTDTIVVWEGKDANRRLLEDIYRTLENTTGEVLIAGLKEIAPDRGDDYAFLNWHLERLQSRGITERILISEDDDNLVAPPHWYRQIPKAYFGAATYQIYADKLSMIEWGEEQKVVVLEHRLFARAFAKLFNFAWDHAKPVGHGR